MDHTHATWSWKLGVEGGLKMFVRNGTIMEKILMVSQGKNLQASNLFDKDKRCKMTTQAPVQFLYIHKEMVNMNYMNNPMYNTSQNWNAQDEPPNKKKRT